MNQTVLFRILLLFAGYSALSAELLKPTIGGEEKEILKKWVLQGGKWDKHWAYIKPELPIVPEVKNISWTTNEIDYFILRKLESKGMSPSKIEEKKI